MHTRRWVSGAAAAIALLVLSGSVAFANPGSIIDFEENLDGGDIVGTLSDGNGIGGDPTTVTAEVNSSPTANRDMIFVADCSGATCTGTDNDLSASGHGNILMYSEDGDSTDPDDADVAGNTLSFVFSVPVTLESIWVIDTEEPLTIRMFDAANAQIGPDIAGPDLEDGQSATVSLNDTPGVSRLDIVWGGSGGLDDLMFFVPTTPPGGGGEGCTPGYWKNHTDRWVGYAPSDSFNTVFGVSAAGNPTLLEAASAGGGGATALGRHAVAALLNAAHGDVDSGQTTADVIALVQSAYNSGDFEAAKDTLEDINEQGCPLGGSSATTGGGNSNPNANAKSKKK